MRISDWSSDVCSSDLPGGTRPPGRRRSAGDAGYRVSLARWADGGARLGGGSDIQPGRLRRRTGPVLRRLDAPDRPSLRQRARLSPTASRATVVRAGGGRTAALTAALSARRTRPALTPNKTEETRGR